jgi:hypothetical protein
LESAVAQTSEWDLEAPIEHLRSSAFAKSKGKCASYTRKAIEAGGLKLTRQVSAQDYGLSLLAVGFVELDNDAAYAKGDVAVIKGFQGHPHGHLQMYDGGQWMSDFKQSGFWPGKDYRDNKPAYKIYRHRTLKATAPTENAILSRWCRPGS